jgi:hypothetical protein
VGEMFETFDIAIAFPSDAPDWMVDDISRQIVHLQASRRAPAPLFAGGPAPGPSPCRLLRLLNLGQRRPSFVLRDACARAPQSKPRRTRHRRIQDSGFRSPAVRTGPLRSCPQVKSANPDLNAANTHPQTTHGTLDELENAYINRQDLHACSKTGSEAAGHGGGNTVVHIEQAGGGGTEGGERYGGRRLKRGLAWGPPCAA